jgi:hypothetical protein
MLVFVDAGLPVCAGETSAAPDFLERLEELATDGVLPAWSTWWGPGAMESLVPDERRRRAIEAEFPNAPLDFYRREFSVPDGWCSTADVGYLLLSEAYRDAATAARERGWSVTERVGGHLDIVNAPAEISRAMLDLAGAAHDGGDLRGA